MRPPEPVSRDSTRDLAPGSRSTFPVRTLWRGWVLGPAEGVASTLPLSRRVRLPCAVCAQVRHEIVPDSAPKTGDLGPGGPLT